MVHQSKMDQINSHDLNIYETTPDQEFRTIEVTMNGVTKKIVIPVTSASKAPQSSTSTEQPVMTMSSQSTTQNMKPIKIEPQEEYTSQTPVSPVLTFHTGLPAPGLPAQSPAPVAPVLAQQINNNKRPNILRAGFASGGNHVHPQNLIAKNTSPQNQMPTPTQSTPNVLCKSLDKLIGHGITLQPRQPTVSGTSYQRTGFNSSPSSSGRVATASVANTSAHVSSLPLNQQTIQSIVQTLADRNLINPYEKLTISRTPLDGGVTTSNCSSSSTSQPVKIVLNSIADNSRNTVSGLSTTNNGIKVKTQFGSVGAAMNNSVLSNIHSQPKNHQGNSGLNNLGNNVLTTTSVNSQNSPLVIPRPAVALQPNNQVMIAGPTLAPQSNTVLIARPPTAPQNNAVVIARPPAALQNSPVVIARPPIALQNNPMAVVSPSMAPTNRLVFARPPGISQSNVPQIILKPPQVPNAASVITQGSSLPLNQMVSVAPTIGSQLFNGNVMFQSTAGNQINGLPAVNTSALVTSMPTQILQTVQTSSSQLQPVSNFQVLGSTIKPASVVQKSGSSVQQAPIPNIVKATAIETSTSQQPATSVIKINNPLPSASNLHSKNSPMQTVSTTHIQSQVVQNVSAFQLSNTNLPSGSNIVIANPTLNPTSIHLPQPRLQSTSVVQFPNYQLQSASNIQTVSPKASTVLKAVGTSNGGIVLQTVSIGQPPPGVPINDQPLQSPTNLQTVQVMNIQPPAVKVTMPNNVTNAPNLIKNSIPVFAIIKPPTSSDETSSGESNDKTIPEFGKLLQSMAAEAEKDNSHISNSNKLKTVESMLRDVSNKLKKKNFGSTKSPKKNKISPSKSAEKQKTQMLKSPSNITDDQLRTHLPECTVLLDRIDFMLEKSINIANLPHRFQQVRHVELDHYSDNGQQPSSSGSESYVDSDFSDFTESESEEDDYYVALRKERRRKRKKNVGGKGKRVQKKKRKKTSF